MKDDVVQFAALFLALVAALSAEELLPKFIGVGFPFLLAATAAVARRARVFALVLFALAAGAAEDALSGLPAGLSEAFFLAVAALVRWTSLERATPALAWPLYQVWLWIWNPALAGNVFARLLVSLPVGFATAVLVEFLFVRLERGAALGEGR